MTGGRHGTPRPTAGKGSSVVELDAQSLVWRHSIDSVVMAGRQPCVLRLRPMNYTVVGQHQESGMVVVPVVHGLRLTIGNALTLDDRWFGHRQVDAKRAASMQDESFSDFAIGDTRRDSDKINGRRPIVDAPSRRIFGGLVYKKIPPEVQRTWREGKRAELRTAELLQTCHAYFDVHKVGCTSWFSSTRCFVCREAVLEPIQEIFHHQVPSR